MPKFSLKQIKIAYYTLSFIFLILVLLTPHIIRDGFSIFSEEVLESIIMFFLIALYITIDYFYQKKINEIQNEISETNEYIGRLNVKMETIDRLFYSDIKIPQTHKEYKNVLSLFAETILGIVNVPTVHLRIINLQDGRTVGECTQNRFNNTSELIKCGNAELLAGKLSGPYLAFESKIKSGKISVFCVLPDNELAQSERTMIQASVNILALILLSYKDSGAG